MLINIYMKLIYIYIHNNTQLMLSPREYKLRLANAITKLPYKEQPHFKSALKPTKYTNEIFIPKTFTHRHIIPKNSSCLRNVLVTFNTNYTKDRKLLQTIRKETSAFSKNYNTINNAVGSANREQIYNELIMKYKAKGFNEATLFPKANVFNQSILLKKDKHFDNIYLVGDKRENKEDRIFVYNTNCYMDKHGSGGRMRLESGTDSDDDSCDGCNEDVQCCKGKHKKNALSLPQVSVKDNRKLKKEIHAIEKLVKEGHKEEMAKTVSTCDGECGNNYGSHEVFKVKMKGSRNKCVMSEEKKMIACKSNTIYNVDGIRKKRRKNVELITSSNNGNNNNGNSNTICNGVKKCQSENECVHSERKRRKRKIIKGSLSEREVMYNKLTRNGFAENEDTLIRYLERTQKGSYDKVK